MNLSLQKVMIIARREYLTTVRRKAFVLTLLITPAIFFFAGIVSTKIQISQAIARQSESRIVAVVDSSGLYAHSPLSFDFQAPVEPSFDPRHAAKPAAAIHTPTSVSPAPPSPISLPASSSVGVTEHSMDSRMRDSFSSLTPWSRYCPPVMMDMASRKPRPNGSRKPASSLASSLRAQRPSRSIV